MSNWCSRDGHGNIISARWPGVVTINNPEHRRVTTVAIQVDHLGNVTVETCVAMVGEPRHHMPITTTRAGLEPQETVESEAAPVPVRTGWQWGGCTDERD